MKATPKTFECRVRLTPDKLQGSNVTVTGPRTGTELTVPTWRVPQPMRGRIVQAVAAGQHVVTFTVDELKAFVFAHKISQPVVMKFAPVYHAGNLRRGMSA